MDKKNNVLIVDDDSSNLMELFHIFRMDYNILSAMDGSSALEKANEYMPDLILLDVIMPDMNGFEVLQELKKSSKTESIPVIFLSGLSEGRDESEGLALGAVDYIRKPINEAIVKHRVRKQLELVNKQRDQKSISATAEPSDESKPMYIDRSKEMQMQISNIMNITETLMQNETLNDEIESGLKEIYASGKKLLEIIEAKTP